MWPTSTSSVAAPTGPRRREARDPRRVPSHVDAGPRPSPHAADPLYAVRPTGGDRLGRHSSRRPPPRQRAAGLQVVHLRVEQLVLHEQLADLGVQSLVLLIPGIRRAALQPAWPAARTGHAIGRPAPP